MALVLKQSSRYFPQGASVPKLRSLCALVLALAVSAQAMASSAPESSWLELTKLAGTWRLAEAKTPRQEAFRISFDPVAADTALLETFGGPPGQPTLTVYHKDGTRILATHYCAQGNQPRLALQANAQDKKGLVFTYLDATNLNDPADPHLVELELRTEGVRLIRREVYVENGKESESTLVLERVE